MDASLPNSMFGRLWLMLGIGSRKAGKSSPPVVEEKNLIYVATLSRIISSGDKIPLEILFKSREEGLDAARAKLFSMAYRRLNINGKKLLKRDNQNSPLSDDFSAVPASFVDDIIKDIAFQRSVSPADYSEAKEEIDLEYMDFGPFRKGYTYAIHQRIKVLTYSQYLTEEELNKALEAIVTDIATMDCSESLRWLLENFETTLLCNQLLPLLGNHEYTIDCTTNQVD